MTVYTFQCFSVFRYKTGEERDGIYLRQEIGMSLIYLLSFVDIYIITGEAEVIEFYAMTQIVLWITMVVHRKLYPEANKLLVNNMCTSPSGASKMLAMETVESVTQVTPSGRRILPLPEMV